MQCFQEANSRRRQPIQNAKQRRGGRVTPGGMTQNWATQLLDCALMFEMQNIFLTHAWGHFIILDGRRNSTTPVQLAKLQLHDGPDEYTTTQGVD
jgi:hypothetical protein